MPVIFPWKSYCKRSESSFISDIINQSSPGPITLHQPSLSFFLHRNLNDVTYSRNEIPVVGISILQMMQNNLSQHDWEFSVMNSILVSDKFPKMHIYLV